MHSLFAALLFAAPAGGSGFAVELDKVVASDAANAEAFGYAVAVAGDVAVVGAFQSSPAGGLQAGAAYVFERSQGNPGSWSEVAKLTASDGAAGDNFGLSVAVSGDTVLVGAYQDDNAGGNSAGAAYVFERDQGGPEAWGEVRKLVASDGSTSALFGHSVALCGDTVLVGARADDNAGGGNAGAAYVFGRDQGGADAWGEVRKLVAGDAASGDELGFSVALEGNTAVVGSLEDDHGGGVDAGAAYVFERDWGGANAWGERAKLTASDAGPSDYFGCSVALSGETVVVGAYYDDNGAGTDAGSAYVFERNQGGAGAFGEVRKLTASAAAAYDYFGTSVAVSGDTALVGDIEALLNVAGSAYVFERDQGGAGAWGEVNRLIASDTADGDEFGIAVALSGDTAFVGAWLDDHVGGNDAGSAYAFTLGPISELYCTAGASASGCNASLSVAGLPSATASSGFQLLANGVEGMKRGVFLFGTSGRQANAWGNGGSYQCVVPPVVRSGVQAGGGTPGACDGAFVQDLNGRWCATCAKPAHNPGAGAFVQAQLWYRDPQNTSNQTTSWSDAIEFLVGP